MTKKLNGRIFFIISEMNNGSGGIFYEHENIRGGKAGWGMPVRGMFSGIKKVRIMHSYQGSASLCIP